MEDIHTGNRPVLLLVELAVVIAVLVSLARDAFQALAHHKRKAAQHEAEVGEIRGGWLFARVVSSLFILVMLGIKWVHVFVLMPQLSVKTAYPVYMDLAAPLRKLQFQDATASGLREAAEDFSKVGVYRLHNA
jgi:hypothetical protein